MDPRIILIQHSRWFCNISEVKLMPDIDSERTFPAHEQHTKNFEIFLFE